MKKTKLNALIKQAHEAGENDTYVEDELISSAQLWIEEHDEEMTTEQCEQLIDAYRHGFFLKPLPGAETPSAIKSILAVLDLSDCELGSSQQELVEDAVRSAVETALS